MLKPRRRKRGRKRLFVLRHQVFDAACNFDRGINFNFVIPEGLTANDVPEAVEIQNLHVLLVDDDEIVVSARVIRSTNSLRE